MTAQTNPIDRIDELNAQLGAAQLEIIGLLAQAGQEHQAVDARFAPQLNPLYRRAQSLFDELAKLSSDHRHELVRGDKKSAKRNTGTIGWRATPRLALQVSEDVLIERIKALGVGPYRRLVRRVVRRELNRDALLSLVNQDTVNRIDGVEVTREDEFFALPSGGVRMSQAHPLWPFLEGVTGSIALNRVVADAEA